MGFQHDEQLFERWCPDPKNLCLIPGYSVEGTLAKTLLDSSPDQITAMDGRTLECNCQVEGIPFIAHADFSETSEFVKRLQPTKIVLVHGEENGMRSLAVSLASLMKHKKNVEVLTPRNTEIVKFKFDRDKVAKIIGKLAGFEPEVGKPLQGLFVTENFVHHVIAAEDIPTYTRLSINQIKQKLHVPYQNKYETLKLFIGEIFDLSFVPQKTKNGSGKEEVMPKIIVSKCVTLTHSPPDRVLLEWDASPVNDMIADAVATIVLQAATSPASVALTSTPCSHNHDHDHTMTSNPEHLKEKQLQILYVLRKAFLEYYFNLGVDLLDEEVSYVGESVKREKETLTGETTASGESDLEKRVLTIKRLKKEYQSHFETYYTLYIEGQHFLALCNLKTGRYLLESLDPEESVEAVAKEGEEEVDADASDSKKGVKEAEEDEGEDIPLNLQVIENVIGQTLLMFGKQMFDTMKFSGIDYHDTEKVVEPDHKVNPDRKELLELDTEALTKFTEELYKKAIQDSKREGDEVKNEKDDSKMEVEETTTKTTSTAGDDTSGIFNIYGTDNPDVLKVFEEETDENLMVAMLDLYDINIESGANP